MEFPAGGAAWVHDGASAVAFTTPSVSGGGGCGGSHLRLPVGGMAKRMPKNADELARATPRSFAPAGNGNTTGSSAAAAISQNSANIADLQT